MRKIILPLILALCLTACTPTTKPNNTISDIPSSSPSETISEQSSDMVSSDESVSSQKLEIPTRSNLDDASDAYLYDLNEKHGKFYGMYYLNEENKIEMRDFDLKIMDLIDGNFSNYRFLYLEPSIEYDGYNQISDDIYPVDISNYTLTYDILVECIRGTYVKAETEKLINDPTYGEKRYHYFEKDGIFYIDQTVAKQEEFIPHDIRFTYRYDMTYYRYDYKFIGENTIQIEVFMPDWLDNRLVKLPLTAVKEDGEWKLEKMTLEKDVVGIE